MRRIALALIATALSATAAVAFTELHPTAAGATGTAGDNTIVQRTTPQYVSSGGSATRVQWNVVLRDDDRWALSPAGITVRYSGVYVVTVQTNWASNNNGIRSVHLQRDATAAHPTQVLAGTNTRTPQWGGPLGLSWTGYLDAGDRLGVYVYQTSGVTLGFGGNVRSPGTESGNAEFGVTRLR